MRCGVDEPVNLEKLLSLFFSYEREEIAEFFARRSISSGPTCRPC
jgi:hypothetical protein